MENSDKILDLVDDLSKVSVTAICDNAYDIRTSISKKGLLECLERHGVIIPPCRIGDPVYEVILCKGISRKASHICERPCCGFHIINAPSYSRSKRFNYLIVYNENTNSIDHISFDKIGKTVFFNKDEATNRVLEYVTSKANSNT